MLQIKLYFNTALAVIFLPIILAVNENSIMNSIGSAVWKRILSKIPGRSKS